MIALLISLAILAACAAVFIKFLDLFLDFFDWIIKKIKGAFRALKVMVLKSDGSVTQEVLVENENGKIESHFNSNVSSIKKEDLPKNVYDDLMNAPLINGKRIGTWNPTEEEIREIKQ